MVAIALGDFTPPAQQPQHIEESLLLFGDFSESQYMPWSEANHSVSHHSVQESILRAQLLPRFSQMQLKEITPKMLEDFVVARKRSTFTRGKQKRPVRASTVNRDIACIKAIFRKARNGG